MLINRILMLLLGCVFSYLLVPQAFSATPYIVIRKTESYDVKSEGYYFKRLLELALVKSQAQYGKAEIAELPKYVFEKRLRSELMMQNIDVLWSPTNAELEAEFLSVKISLLKELNDYRLLLIRPEMQPQFSRVKTLMDLRQFKGGIGSHWTDASIMEANDLPVVKAVAYAALFKMLAAKRFDYFSRGLYQIQTEVNLYPELHLAIEKDLMLHYPNEVYFFVHKDNKALAERLKFGLEAAQSDGSFDALFNSIPRYQWGSEQLKHHQRRILQLLPMAPPQPRVNTATK